MSKVYFPTPVSKTAPSK